MYLKTATISMVIAGLITCQGISHANSRLPAADYTLMVEVDYDSSRPEMSERLQVHFTLVNPLEEALCMQPGWLPKGGKQYVQILELYTADGVELEYFGRISESRGAGASDTYVVIPPSAVIERAFDIGTDYVFPKDGGTIWFEYRLPTIRCSYFNNGFLSEDTPDDEFIVFGTETVEFEVDSALAN